MDKTTLCLDGDDYRKLRRIAARDGRPPAALVREAVAEYVVRRGAPVVKSVGAFASGRRDLSERAEDLLEGFGRPAPARTPRGRR